MGDTGALSLGGQLSQDLVWGVGWGCLWNEAGAEFSTGGPGQAPLQGVKFWAKGGLVGKSAL